jgi:hypothetical protein
MAKTAPGVFRHGTARQEADKAVGYVSSGAGEFSRKSARASLRGFAAISRASRKANGDDKREFLALTVKRIEELNCDLSLETDPHRRAKLERDLDCKLSLAERLRDEIFCEKAGRDGEQ